MAEQAAQEKTEQATPRKRKQARGKGQVARSQELSSFLLLMTALLTLVAMAPRFGTGMTGIMRGSMDIAFGADVTVGSMPALTRLWMEEGLRMLMPLWLILLLAGTGASIAQVGFQANGELLLPKPDRLNPINGFKRIFSKRSAFEFAKSLFKMCLLFTITYITLRGEAAAIINLADLEILPALTVLGKVALKLATRLILMMLVLSLADFAFQKWQHEQDIMMTAQELKEEYKETEGDPLLKSRLRALQREISLRRMMEDVKTADVVVTNPTHFAVALLYKENAGTPKVVAKGVDKVAHRIKEVAREAGVPVVENKPLARALHAECKIGDAIPIKFFQAVAELLAYVYQIGKGAAASRS